MGKASDKHSTLLRVAQEMSDKAAELKYAARHNRYDFSYIEGAIELEQWANTLVAVLGSEAPCGLKHTGPCNVACGY